MIPRRKLPFDRIDQPLNGRGTILEFEGHLIRFLRSEFLAAAHCFGAFAVIEPPTNLPAPDVVLGLGTDEDAARKDVFARAHAKITNTLDPKGGRRGN